jgi:GT2 family glycosyltransferase
MSEQVLLSAVVVNHRRRELLAACLASLTEALAAVAGATEVIVVDNGSDDGSVEMVRERHSEAGLVLLEDNHGFAAAVNEGLRRSRGDWLLLLNNDATLEPSAAHLLLEAGRRSPDVGSVACQMRFTGTEVLNSAGIGVDRLGVAFDRLLGEPASASEREPVEVFGASGGAALYRRAMLHDIGGFDDSFFVYLEDADVAWRARMRGWRCLYQPAAVANHHYSATSGHRSSFKYFHSGRNRVRLVAKNAARRQLARHGPHMLAYDLAYVAGVAVRDRTLAPLAGRLQGLREWRRYRSIGAARRPVELAPAQGVRGGLRRRASWARHAAEPPRRQRRPAVTRADRDVA